ncbi:hypothetical protein RAS1_29650 [Phycisphaerae bacterium RAS1]|nr:hypothetical protein RAS1_29650 [Phycisphaerae bacterium RAS1]
MFQAAILRCFRAATVHFPSRDRAFSEPRPCIFRAATVRERFWKNRLLTRAVRTEKNHSLAVAARKESRLGYWLPGRYDVVMGMFQAKVSIANPLAPERLFTEPFWVDTGALYSFAPEDRLHAIGIVPKFTRDFVFADGKKDRRLVGEAAFTIDGLAETITCLIVFGPPQSLFLLGATALENFGVQADPTTQKLRPITAVIGTAWATRAR